MCICICICTYICTCIYIRLRTATHHALQTYLSNIHVCIYPTYHNCPVAPFSSTPAISGLSAVHPSRERPAPPRSPCPMSLRRLSSGSSGESICIIRVSLSCGSGPEGAEGRGGETGGVPLSGWMFGGVESGFKSCSRLSSLSVSCRRRVSCRLALARSLLSSCIYHVYIDDDISTVWVYIHTYISTCTYTCTYIYTDTCTQTNTHVHTYPHVHTHAHEDTDPRMKSAYM